MPPFTLPSETEIVLSVPVLLFSLAVCVVAGVLAGCAPAWQASRGEPRARSMKDGGRSVSSARHGLRRTLVIVEFALALTLLSGGGMAVQALVRMMNADLGFRPERVVRFTLPVPDGRLPTRAGRSRCSIGNCSTGRRPCRASSRRRSRPACPCGAPGWATRS